MVGFLAKLLPGAWSAFNSWREGRQVLAELKGKTEGELLLSEHKLNVLRTKLAKGSWTDDIMLGWLLAAYSIPFAPAVYTLAGGDLNTALQASKLAKDALDYTFGEEAGWIMGAVVAAIFGFSRMGRKL